MKRLNKYITSDYVAAANKLKGKTARQRIVAYVESYDDVLFWRMALSPLETPERYFEVMLPSRDHLSRGKKQAILTVLENGVGENMIACVDADYDYLSQGMTHESQTLLGNPYVFHTYVYAIENYQCYAPSLHNVCVMATLNDRQMFDFQTFLAEYSKAIFQLFVWNIMIYRRREYGRFTMTEFNTVITLRHSRLEDIMEMVQRVRHKVKVKLQDLRRQMPDVKDEYVQTRDSLIELGVTPETTYLYIQGHHLFNNVVLPTLQTVCDELRRSRESEIRSQACHVVQMQNELSAYSNSISDIAQMLKKNTGYMMSPQYQQLQQQLANQLNKTTTNNEITK